MAEYDSSAMLSLMKLEMKRPTNSPDVDDTILYQDLTEGLRWVSSILAKHGLEMNAVWEQATTSDNMTYTITTQPDVIVMLRDGRNGPFLMLGTDGDPHADLVWQGTTFLVPDNQTRAFGGGLQVRYIPQETAITASVQPTLQPARARLVAVYHAAEIFLGRGGYRDVSFLTAKKSAALFGDPNVPGDCGIIGSRKQAFAGPGQRGPGAMWYKSFLVA